MIHFDGEIFEDFFNIQLIEEFNQIVINFSFEIPEIVTSIQFDIISTSKLRRYEFSNNYLPVKESEFQYRIIENVFNESKIEYFLFQNNEASKYRRNHNSSQQTDESDQILSKNTYKECTVIFCRLRTSSD